MKKNIQLYSTLWRWHFYAGLFCIPFLMALAVTGAIYLFKPQIDQWNERHFQNLAIAGERTAPWQQIAAAEDISGANFVSYRLPQHERQAVVITVAKQGERQLVYVNPYTLEVLKVIGYNDQFIRVVRTLHGELLLGNTGAIAVELAGCWAIVMLITGLYLWWPRNAVGIAGVIYPRLKKGSRVFWRDLHAVTGFWIAFFTLFLLISGLPWALVWGTAFKELRALGQQPVQQDWVVNEHAHHGEDAHPAELRLTNAVLTQAQELAFAAPVELSIDKQQPLRWKVSSQHQNRPLRADAWLEASGEVVEVKPFAERKLVDRVIGVGIAAHEGHLFGWLNQLLGLIVTLGILLVSVSGFILWRKRKPQGVLGAPPKLPDSRVGMAVLAVTLVTAAFLPLLAISLVLLWLLEKLLFSRMARIRVWLGLDPLRSA